ncbi:MAG: sigma-70 family RNA polymerase sigma factor [Acidobacteriota bacterium]
MEEEKVESLIRRAKKGEREAFDTLIQMNEGKVLSVIRYMGVPATEVEDVAQEAFIRLFRYIRRFRSGEKFSRWLYRISVNAAIDHLRKERIRPIPVSGFEEDLLVKIASENPGAEEDMRFEQLKNRLKEKLLDLSDRERAIFVLRDIEGLSTKEIARSLKLNSITVRRHSTLARKKLIDLLKL